MEFFSYYGGFRGARIEIRDSDFKVSRFCLGMITYRMPIYIKNIRSFVNITHHLMPTAIYNDTGSFIIIKDCTFNNLNFLTNVTALAIYDGVTPKRSFIGFNSLESLQYDSFIHKSIILNVEDFNGTIEIDGCSFLNNFHFIPEIMNRPYQNGLVRD